MPKKSVAKALDEMPEAFVSDTTITRACRYGSRRAGYAISLPGVTPHNLTAPPEAVVKRNLWHIAAAYFPAH